MSAPRPPEVPRPAAAGASPGAAPAVPVGETLFEEMKRYVRFGAADAELLIEFGRHAEPHFARVAEEFYDRIREHEAAHDVFTGEEQVERLKRSLVRWMGRVCSGRYDEAYFEETAKIGRMHVRVGLEQRYMFTAMALIRLAFEAIADGAMGARAAPARAAISKILYLELAIMLETYRDDFVARTQRHERVERAELDRSLARAEHRYKNAIELARILVVGLDAGANIRMMNHEAERVTGLGRGEVFGRSFVEALLPPALREEQGPLIAAMAAGQRGGGGLLESAVQTRAGKIRDVRWQLAFSPSEAGDEVVLFAIGQDTTDENALEARARQSEKLAAVGTLAAGLAHEIRNPLNGAQLHVTFLQRGLQRAGVTDPDTVEAVTVVAEEIRRLSVLVSEFLDFARPKPLQKRATSVRALCEHAAQMVAPDASAALVELKTDLPTTDVTLDVDPAKMEQVLLNLLRNGIEAVQASSAGSVVLRARRHPRQVVLEVEDDGPGLPNPDAPIFDPFFSTKPQGTGLGLAIVHRIVTDHGGTIDFQTRPGRTLFRVALPIQIAAQ